MSRSSLQHRGHGARLPGSRLRATAFRKEELGLLRSHIDPGKPLLSFTTVKTERLCCQEDRQEWSHSLMLAQDKVQCSFFLQLWNTNLSAPFRLIRPAL